MAPEQILHYRIEEKLGEGGMGEVYLATDTKLGRKVALKFLPGTLSGDAEARERLIREAKAASALHHPNILTVHAVEEAEGRDFIVMEYVEGQTLAEYASKGACNFDDMVQIAIQIGEGLDEAHTSGIVHRDLKPSNILIDTKGRVRILDFGLAKVEGATRLTQTGSTVGTMAYSSPEQIQAGELDHRSDLFSFGVVLYEMIAGRLPFQGEHEAAILYAITNETPEPLARFKSGVSDELQRIVSKCLNKLPAERYQSASDLVADLEHQKRTSKSPVFATAQPGPPRHRKGLILSFAGVIALALALLISKPWGIQVTPSNEAVGAENRLAVMYFNNLADPDDSEKLGEITASLLISDMSTSHAVQVVSDQRLYDILKLLGHENVHAIDRDVASQVAEKADARFMLMGDILRTEPNLELTAQLVDVADGTVLASPHISGQSGEDIFALVDQLSAKIRKQLSPSGAAEETADLDVSSMTTSSTEAYAHYLQGWNWYYQYSWSKAETEFRKAIDADSEFVQAYYGLSFVPGGTDSRDIISAAEQRMGRLGDREQMLIRARSAWLHGKQDEAIAIWEKLVEEYPDEKEALVRLAVAYRQENHYDLARSIECNRRVIEIDPLFKDAYNKLAYDYTRHGESELAIWAVNKHIEMAPDEPNPYDTRGDVYALAGRIDQAIDSYQKVIDFGWWKAAVWRRMAFCLMIQQEYERADSVLHLAAADPSASERSEARRYRVNIPLYRGQLREALRRANAGLEADIIERGEGLRHQRDGQFARKTVFQHMFDYYEDPQWLDSVEAVVRFEEQLYTSDTSFTDYGLDRLKVTRANLAADKGQLKLADSLYESYLSQLDTTQRIGLILYLEVQTNRARKQKDLNEATRLHTRLTEVHQALNPERVRTNGEIALEAGLIADAVKKLEWAENRIEPRQLPPYTGLSIAKLHYNLARAYEQSGWRDKAIEQYERFLDIWRNADPEIKILDEARQSLTKLKSQAS